MIPGGIADKLGNRYEAKWLVRCFLDLVGNKAAWLKFESLESDYHGFEFALQRGNTTEWHQTKINAPKGNWTIKALKNEGVLKAFKNRLSSCENAHCFFVSQDSSRNLRTISDKARMTNDLSQFKAVLTIDEKDDFPILCLEWNCNEDIAFGWLRRSYVNIIPESQIESLIESFGDFYFQQSGQSLFPALREILETHFNKKITPEIAREAIKTQGLFTLKEWSLDPTIAQKLRQETEAYLQTYSPFGVGGETIHRNQAAEVIEEVSRSNGGNLILLTGVAGSGKSGVIRAVIENLGQHAIPHLAFRIDHFLSCATREELGTKLTGRQESPVSTLKGISPTETAVLIIDQVDAVSEVSGRDGRVREVIFRIIEDSKNFGGIRVIVVCRTFDLESDSRLKSLKEANQSKQIDVPTLNWNTEVLPVLKSKGIKTSGLSESQKNLLCLPVNLAVFLEIGESEFGFQSRSALFEKLIEKKQRVIAKGQKPPWALIDPLAKLGEWMSDRQQLKAPAATLCSFPCAMDILTSEGLIVSSREQVNFFHESFFDYIYARTFLLTNQSLMGLLTSSEQHLFRRTQIRQILDVRRQGDFDRYLNELERILSSDQVRFHIKSSVSQWLSSVEEPTLQEFEIISSLDNPMEPFNQLVRKSLLSTHHWFDLLNDKGWVQNQLLSNQQIREETILWWLSQIAGERPDEIACLLREWWENIPYRGERLLSWFGYMKRNKDDQSLLNLCNDIIKSYPKKNPFSEAGRNSLSMLLHTLWTKKSALNGEILHSIFDNWLDMNPGQTPFERDVLKDGEMYALSEFANKDLQAFLAGTTDALIKSIDIVISKGPHSQTWYYFKNRTYSGHRFGFDEFLGMYRTALQTIARNNPEQAFEYLDKLDFNKHECLMHLHLEAIQANPQILAKRLITLIENPMVFEGGYKGADWFSLANAVRAALPHLKQQERLNVEQVVFNYHPEIDQAKELHSCILKGEVSHQFYTYSSKDVIRILNRSGYTERCILETIGETNLSVNGRARLGELRRKFPTFNKERPAHVEAQTVGSPIKSSNCERMSDKNWLSAIQYYNGKENPKEKRIFPFVGGARELAGELQKATKRDPERFSSLTMSIPFTAHNSYIQHILWGLAETDEPSEMWLSQAIHRAHSHPDKPFGEEIAQLIETHPAIAQGTEILEVLLWYAEHGEANVDDTVDERNTEEERITIEDLLAEGQSLQVRGRNGARGLAWEALGAVVCEVPSAKNRIWDILEHALTQEDRISVRCCMIKTLTPLFFNDDKNRFTNAIQSLLVLPERSPNAQKPIRLSPLVTYEGIRLFPYIFYHLPELGDKLISDLLNSGDPNMELVGAWLIFCESYRNDVYIDRADCLTNQSLDHRRLMADVSADALKWTEYRNRAEEKVQELFFDEDEQIRKLAAGAFRKISPDEVENYRDLAKRFLNSPAFTENSHVIFPMLENATCDILDLVLEASSQIIEDIAAKGDQHGSRSLDLHELQELLKKEYTSSEGKPDARKKILDLIDLMLEHELYGVDAILSAHER